MNKIFFLIVILLTILSRLMNHPPNFTPILSIALLSGVYFKNKYFVVFPILIMFVSDLVIGNTSMSMWVYSSILLIFLIGKYFVDNATYKNLITTSLLSALLFYLITNFGVWVVGYPKTMSGFISCYTLAIPFFKNTLLSTIIYSLVLKSLYDIVLNKKLLFFSNK